MTIKRLGILIAAVAVSALVLSVQGLPAIAGDEAPGSPSAGREEAGALRFVPLGVGKSVTIDLPRDAKEVLVADPKIANAVVRSARRAYLIGVSVGQTNVYFFDANGQQIAGYDIAVTRDLNGIRSAIKRALPNADIRIEGLGDGVVLTGTVANAAEGQHAFDLASRLAGEDTKVVNGLVIKGREQIMLKVTVAEVQRDVIKQLGINLSGSLGFGTTVLNFNTSNPFSVTGQPLSTTAVKPGWMGGINPNPNRDSFLDGNGVFRNTLQATLQAAERAGVVRTLAEPNLTAISGESADFLVGGEFPILAGFSCQSGTNFCQPTIQFKKFGVSLNFTPVVLSEGRISLKVKTEVSELSTEGAFTMIIGSQMATIPSLRVRRADTTIEIPSGGTLAMAGMIQEQTKQAINGFPGLMQVPILGALFKSRDYINKQTELVVLVTPYVVRAVAEKQLARPDDGFVDSSDPSAILLGRFNRIYGVPGRPVPAKAYHGKYGFILD
jgi:pilus assembly protein CpaC